MGGIYESRAGQNGASVTSWRNCRDSKSRLVLSFQAVVFDCSFMTKN
jgi:hypothetical protein